MKNRMARGFCIALGLIVLASLSSAQVFFRIGGPHTDVGQNIAADKYGNLFVAGWFQGTMDFDPGPGLAERTAAGDPLDPVTGADAVDIFLAKYDPAGKFLWVITLGAEGPDKPRALDLDQDGNIVLAGYISGKVDFDPSENNLILDAGGEPKAFIAKYDTDGALLWAFELENAFIPEKTGDEPVFENTLAVAVDGEGHIAVTGAFLGSIDLDPSGRSGRGAVFTSDSGSPDIFIASYSSLGEYRWGCVLEGPGINQGRAVRPDSDGNLIVAGVFSGAADFDPGSETARLQARGPQDIFIAKYDSKGNLLWAKRAGGPGVDRVGPGALALDNDSQILLTGEFSLTAEFDAGGETPPLVARGESDIFTAKYNADGTLLWAVSAGSVYRDFGCAVAVDDSGHVLVTGSFRGAADFDPSEKENILLPKGSPDVGDIFLVKYDPSGGLLWARAFGGPENTPGSLQAGLGLAVDARGNVIVTGRFHLAADFDPGTYAEILTSAGCADVFVAQIDGDGNLVASRLRHPPLQFRGYKFLNRSLSQSEYINILSWARNPDDPGAVAYRIYLVEGESLSLKAEVDASTFTYLHRGVERDISYHYICTAVDIWGNEGGTAATVVR